MRYRPEHKAATRERILDAAARRFREGGASAVQIPGCMADVGLSHGGFYHHFESKDEFISETLSRIWTQSHGVAGLAGTAAEPALALGQFLDRYLSITQCERSRGACLLPIALPEVDNLPAQAGEVVRTAVSQLTGQIQGLLTELGAEDPESAAALLVAELIGIITFARAQSPAKQGALLAAARRQLRDDLGLASGERADL